MFKIPEGASSTPHFSTQVERTLSKKDKEIDFSRVRDNFQTPQFSKGIATGKEYQQVADRYGHKTTNLCVLQSIVNTIKDVSSQIVIPDFFAIEDRLLRDYLNEQCSLNQLWEQFVQAQGNSPELQEDALKILQQIRDKLEEVFSKEMPPSISEKLSHFLNEHEDHFLMVRSSGHEDRVGVVNAGGNESVASVRPNTKEVWKAMGVVVASYFSEKSLKQRLISQDTITEDYFIPVMLQQMVGEKVWEEENPAASEIPVSGVMFTQDVASHTPGLTKIEAAYGHNQGVVNSLVDVDSFYIGHSGVIHPVVREKSHRLVAMKIGDTHQLHFVRNEEKISKDSVLDKVVLEDLKRVSDHLQTLYDHPMDIEFVVQKREGKSIISLVQVRPLVEKEYSHKPDFIREEYLKSIEAKVNGVTVTHAGDFCRFIESREEVIIRDELPQALEEYHNHQKREGIKAVILRKKAPSTSHEATMFRSYGVPVIVVEGDPSFVERHLADDKKILIDTQRGVVTTFTGNEDQLATVLSSGWYTHPVEMAITTMSKFLGLGRLSKDHLKEVTPKKEGISTGPLRNLLESIKVETNREQLVQSLRGIVHQIGVLTNKENILNLLEKTYPSIDSKTVKNFVNYLVEIPKNESLIAEANNLTAQALLAAAEVLYTFDQLQLTKEMDQESLRLQLLYPIKFLESLVLQQQDEKIVNAYSYLILKKGLKEELESFAKFSGELSTEGKEEKQTASYLVQFMKASKLLLSEPSRKVWQEFVRSMTTLGDKSKESVFRFAAMLKKLQQLNVLEIWVNSRGFCKTI